MTELGPTTKWFDKKNIFVKLHIVNDCNLTENRSVWILAQFLWLIFSWNQNGSSKKRHSRFEAQDSKSQEYLFCKIKIMENHESCSTHVENWNPSLGQPEGWVIGILILFGILNMGFFKKMLGYEYLIIYMSDDRLEVDGDNYRELMTLYIKPFLIASIVFGILNMGFFKKMLGYE